VNATVDHMQIRFSRQVITTTGASAPLFFALRFSGGLVWRVTVRDRG
jgi:hypothetical protein